jgi:hypothetical protein
MAGKVRARLLYPTISTSERVSGLGLKGALLFTWFLAHCDDQGRYAGGVRKIKAEVAPLLDEITADDVKAAFEAMEDADLIIRYSAGGRGYIQVTAWWEFNAGLRYTSRSRHPPPDSWIDRVTRRDEHGRFIGGRQARMYEDYAVDYVAGEDDD